MLSLSSRHLKGMALESAEPLSLPQFFCLDDHAFPGAIGVVLPVLHYMRFGSRRSCVDSYLQFHLREQFFVRQFISKPPVPHTHRVLTPYHSAIFIRRALALSILSPVHELPDYLIRTR